ncbi:hypothetical protein SAMN05660964_00760 [Thiothrix caldifontis]|uniref:Uncharacterized protein n=1 Tax=Thiothrix caldifontis TaxID=525918 RepID=A0A1H3XPE0_9GAMM|nr:hypothetical protein SAMN05660964_00760 [Thiothrix caldifontis]
MRFLHGCFIPLFHAEHGAAYGVSVNLTVIVILETACQHREPSKPTVSGELPWA